MSTNIYDLANELDRAIRHLPEYQAVQEARKKIDQDDKAKQVYQDYLAFQTEIQTAIQSGQLPSQEMQEKMQQFSKTIEENALLSEFFTKQQQLSVYISDLERIIFTPLRDLF